MSSLSETLDMAAIRLVDPDLIEETSYAQVLPMLIPTLTGEKTMPVLDFKKNIILDRKPGDTNLVHLEYYKVLHAASVETKVYSQYSFDLDFPTP